jgi:hypothetical protein
MAASLLAKKKGTIPDNATADVTVDEYHRYKVGYICSMGMLNFLITVACFVVSFV